MQAGYSPNSFRVKVYKLNAEGNWDDKGTGLVSAETMEVRPPALPGSAMRGVHGSARRAGCCPLRRTRWPPTARPAATASPS
jgi:hypothetical protein